MKPDEVVCDAIIVVIWIMDWGHALKGIECYESNIEK